MKQQLLNFRFKKSILILSSLIFLFQAYAQNLEIKGKVIDASSKKIIEGASVIVKNTSYGTATNAQGEFSIKSSKGNEIVISYLGYETKSVKISNEKYITIQLLSSSQQLNDVVVTALGVKKETKKVGYAIQEVNASELLKAREPNAVNSLVGKVAGLNVGINQELLGAPNVQLRGNNVSFYVVDGVPINSDTWNISNDDIETITVLKGPAAAALYGFRGINGAILITTKKAKSSRKGFTVELNSGVQINKGFIAIPKVQNEYGGGDNQQYAFGDGLGGGINDADYDVWGPRLDGRLLPQYNSPVDPVTGVRKATPYLSVGTDNLKKFLQAGLLTTNNINLSSSTDKSNFRMSVTSTYQRGITPNTQLNGLNFNMYGSYDITSKLKVEGNLNYNRQSTPNIPDVQYGPNSIIYNIDIWTGADWNIDDMHNYWQAGKVGTQSIFAEYKRYHNPYFMSYEWLRGHYKNDFYGYYNLSYKINKNFEAFLRSGVTTYGLLRTEKLPWSAHPYGEEHNHGEYREDVRNLFESNHDFRVTYNNRDIANSGIGISAFAGGALRTFKYASSFTTTTKLLVPGVYNFNNSDLPIRAANFGSNMLVTSEFFSIDLNFRKYLNVTATGRIDKSSAFTVGSQSFFYPSVSASSVISDYSKLPSFISFLKIRGSFANVKGGATTPYIGAPRYGDFVGYGGNYQTTYDGPDYSLSSAYSLTTTYNNVTGSNATGTIVDPNIKQFTRTNYEGGFDIKFLRNRLGLTATYFNYLNGPGITNVAISQTSGYSNFLTNAVKTSRHGFEFSLQGTPIQNKKGLTWNVLANISTYREVYKELPTGLTSYQLHNGDRTDKLWGSAEAKTPDGKYIVDNSGLPIYLPKSQFMGYGDPDFSWGVNNRFSYKSFTFSFQFDGMVGGRIQDRVKRKLYEGGRGAETNQGAIGQARRYESDHWQDVGYKGAYNNGAPILGSDGVQIANGSLAYDPVTGVITNGSSLTYTANKTATHWIQDFVSGYYNDPEHTMTSKTFAKLREMIITYSLPVKWLNKTSITKVDISLVGRNLLYFFNKNFKDIDVDQYPGRSISNGTSREYDLQSPTTRSYGFNVNIGF